MRGDISTMIWSVRPNVAMRAICFGVDDDM
jgi:hypothetical protein